MRSGSLKLRLTIQSVTSTGDGMGGTVGTWSDDRTVWGAVWPLRGQELIVAQQQQSEITHQISIRYVEGVTAKNRIRLGDSTTYFDIMSPPINPEMANKELRIYARQQG